MKTDAPERVWLEGDEDFFSGVATCWDETTADTDIEYVKASLLKDDKWLDGNGLCRVTEVTDGSKPFNHGEHLVLKHCDFMLSGGVCGINNYNCPDSITRDDGDNGKVDCLRSLT